LFLQNNRAIVNTEEEEMKVIEIFTRMSI